MGTRVGGRLLWSVVLAPVLVLVTLVVRHWVDVPYGDQWELPTDIRQVHTEGPDASELWRQHNEHRIVFPRLAMLLLAWPTEFDSRAQMSLSLVLAAATLLAVVLLLRRTFAEMPRAVVIATATVTAAVLFSPMQYENWLWGFQISWFMNVLGVVAATTVLTLWPRDRRPIEPVLVAIACVVLAQYSLASGTLAWICLTPLLLLDPRHRRLLPVWGAAAVVSTTAYFLGYSKPAGHPPLSEVFAHPLEGVRYVCLFLGRTVFADRDLGVAVGALLLTCFAGLCVVIGFRRRALWPPAAPWICIAAYVLCSAAGAATSRAGFGIGQAAASRYTTISLLFLLATLVLASLVLAGGGGPGRSVRPAWPAVLAPWVLVLGFLVADYPDQDGRMADLEVVRQEARQCLLAATTARDPCLNLLYPRPAQLYPRIVFLRELGWLPDPRGASTASR